MADDEQDKSELPTSFKLKKSRERGVVARGNDLGFATGLIAVLGYLWVSGPALKTIIERVGRDSFIGGFSLSEGSETLISTFAMLLSPAIRPIATLAGAVFLFVLLFELVQTGFVFSVQALKPDFSRLNPATNLKRMLSLRLLIEALKNIVKLVFYATTAYLIISGILRAGAGQMTDGRSLAQMMAHMGLRLLAAATLLALFFAAVDQIIARRDFLGKMRMSRRELRREVKDREGEPRLKQRRKQLHRELAKVGKNLRNVRSADVMIVNPTHYAVALQYDPGKMLAPVVVSSGTDRIAERMKKLAFIYNVPVVENRMLARELYQKCAVETAVPENFYSAVADIYNTIRRKTQTVAEVEDNV